MSVLQSSVVGTDVGANIESATQPFYDELQIPGVDLSLGINLKSLVTEIYKRDVLGQLQVSRGLVIYQPWKVVLLVTNT